MKDTIRIRKIFMCLLTASIAVLFPGKGYVSTIPSVTTDE